MNPDRGTEYLEPLGSRDEFERQYDRCFNVSMHRSAQAYRAESAETHASALERAVRADEHRTEASFRSHARSPTPLAIDTVAAVSAKAV